MAPKLSALLTALPASHSFASLFALGKDMYVKIYLIGWRGEFLTSHFCNIIFNEKPETLRGFIKMNNRLPLKIILHLANNKK